MSMRAKCVFLLDTSALMHPHAERFVRNLMSAESQAPGVKIVAPMAVVLELGKLKSSRISQTRSKALRADSVLSALRKERIVFVHGEPDEGGFADPVLQAAAIQLAQKYPVSVVTQDRDLAHDILQLVNRRSVNTAHAVTAFRIADNGECQKWALDPVKGASYQQLTGAPAMSSTPSNKYDLREGKPRMDDVGLPASSTPGAGDKVFVPNGQPVTLSKKLGEGGEGAVFECGQNSVCKIFAAKRRTRLVRDKIQLMLAKPISAPGICWPRSKVLNSEGHFVGYVMPRASGTELQRAVFGKKRIMRHFASWNRENLVQLSITIAEKILLLHERNIILGDINPLNFLVTDEKTVCLVDTDSYQVQDFPCPVGTAAFTPPEIQGKNFKSLLRTPSHESFAVSTLLFMILLPGKSPYSHTGGSDPGQNVRRGHFPYALGERRGQGTPLGSWRYLWSHLPRYLRQHFYDVFAEGERPDTAASLAVLRRYRNDLRKGFVSNDLFPKTFKRLGRELVLQKGGKWVICGDCGQGFGVFPNERQDHTDCPDCRMKEVAERCFLCDKSFNVAKSKAERVRRDGKHVVCASCRAEAVSVTCSACGSCFQIPWQQRCFFKSKDFSLPKRCRDCRARGARAVMKPARFIPPTQPQQPAPTVQPPDWAHALVSLFRYLSRL